MNVFISRSVWLFLNSKKNEGDYDDELAKKKMKRRISVMSLYPVMVPHFVSMLVLFYLDMSEWGLCS
jgi:hypothetical protein